MGWAMAVVAVLLVALENVNLIICFWIFLFNIIYSKEKKYILSFDLLKYFVTGRVTIIIYVLSSVLFYRKFVFRELLLYTVRELFKKKDPTTKLPNSFVALLVVPPRILEHSLH